MFYNAIYHSNCSYNDKPGFLKRQNFSLKIAMLSRFNDFRKLDDIKCNRTVRFNECPSAKMLFFKLLMNNFNNIFVQIFFRGKSFVSVRISFLKNCETFLHFEKHRKLDFRIIQLAMFLDFRYLYFPCKKLFLTDVGSGVIFERQWLELSSEHRSNLFQQIMNQAH